jgi:hypothetical protein
MDFGWLVLWELKPEVLGSLWLTASATCGGITLTEGLLVLERWVVPLLNYTLAVALKLRKSKEILSQGSVIIDY